MGSFWKSLEPLGTYLTTNWWVLFAFGAILLVLGWKMNAPMANSLLFLAWIVFLIAIFRAPIICNQLILPRTLWTTLLGSGLGLLLYYVLWTPLTTEIKQGLGADKKTQELTLYDLFKGDFDKTMKVKSEQFIEDSKGPTAGRKYRVEYQIYLDWPSRAKFLGFYLPNAQADFVDDMIVLGENYQETLADIERKLSTRSGYSGDEPMDMKELVFTGQVILYYEGILSPSQKTKVFDAYKKLGLNPQFRGLDYLTAQNLARKAKENAKLPQK